MTVRIKSIANGWIINHDTYEQKPDGTLAVGGQRELAVSWDTDAEQREAWERVLKIVTTVAGPYLQGTRLVVSVTEEPRP